jgi:hypothetical protein
VNDDFMSARRCVEARGFVFKGLLEPLLVALIGTFLMLSSPIDGQGDDSAAAASDSPSDQGPVTAPAPRKFPPLPDGATIVYKNRGDNLKDVKPVFDPTLFKVEHGNIVGRDGGCWESLPVYVCGDAQIDYDVYTDAGDSGAFFILYGSANKEGINIVNCPNNTFNGHNIIEHIYDLLDHQKFYYTFDTLTTQPSTNFPRNQWVHVTITKKGDQLIDNVGGQVVHADISSAQLSGVISMGLGFYATKNIGGGGMLKYANIRVIQLSAANVPKPDDTTP